jgi:hypothetical protein
MRRAQAILDAQHLRGAARILLERGYEGTGDTIVRLANRILDDAARPPLVESDR